MRIVVIGGGAAGFFGAIVCAQTYPQAHITLLEAGRQFLSKVRISGGGRCNVTHACFDPAALVQHYPRGSKALRGAFTRFQARDTVDWFTAQGVTLKTETDGRMFPITDDSATIVDCLLYTAKNQGINLRSGTAVTALSRQNSTFEVQLKSGDVLESDRLLLATGNNPQGYQIAESLGHQIESPVPSLFTFNLSDPRLHDLAGVSVPSVRLRLTAADGTHLEQTGAILVTHWGLSGPAVLKLSAWGARLLHSHHYHATLQINWLPQYKPDELRQQLLTVRSQLAHRAMMTSCPVPLPRRLWERLLNTIGISSGDRWAEVPNKVLNQLIQELTQGIYAIEGKGVFKEEFVTCGGINLKEVDFKTMQSRHCPGLYFAGEILDIDGVTGGFNFQSAWTTGWIAGKAIGA